MHGAHTSFSVLHFQSCFQLEHCVYVVYLSISVIEEKYLLPISSYSRIYVISIRTGIKAQPDIIGLETSPSDVRTSAFNDEEVAIRPKNRAICAVTRLNGGGTCTQPTGESPSF